MTTGTRAGVSPGSVEEFRRHTLVTLWITYGSFYLCRQNLSPALGPFQKEFGYSNEDAGILYATLYVTYGIGQIVNGIAGDKMRPHLLVLLGMGASILLNVAFGLAGGAIVLLAVVWGANGFFQSMGWAPVLRIATNWYPPERRGLAFGFLGTSYIAGHAATWALCSLLLAYLDWRAVLLVPAGLFLLSALNFRWRIVDRPEALGLPGSEPLTQPGASDAPREPFFAALLLVLRNRVLWIYALAFFFIDFIRGAFLTWVVKALSDSQKIGVAGATLKSTVIPLGGCAGALLAGWLSDRLFRGRRAPLAAIMMLLLAGATYLLMLQGREPPLAFLLILLFAIGFLMYGPHVLVSAHAPADFGTRRAASTAAGFIDGVGYAGTACASWFSGWLVDTYGDKVDWTPAFLSWIAAALVGAALCAVLWRAEPRKA